MVLVHAHPDDETLSTGGTIARYAAEPDTAVTVVTCTLGEEGEVIPVELAGLAADRADQLGGYRIGELARAAAALGLRAHRFLGGVGRWRDSGMVLAGHGVRATAREPLHPRAFAHPAALDEQVDTLAEVLAELRPQVVLSYGEDGGYGHPDHVRAHRIMVAAAERTPGVAKLYFTATSRSRLDEGLAAIGAAEGMPFRLPDPDELPAVPDDLVTTWVDAAARRGRRIAALRAHATQVSVWERGATVAYAMSNGVAQPLLDVEEFVLAGGAPGPETDLFDGVAS